MGWEGGDPGLVDGIERMIGRWMLSIGLSDEGSAIMICVNV